MRLVLLYLAILFRNSNFHGSAVWFYISLDYSEDGQYNSSNCDAKVMKEYFGEILNSLDSALGKGFRLGFGIFIWHSTINVEFLPFQLLQRLQRHNQVHNQDVPLRLICNACSLIQ